MPATPINDHALERQLTGLDGTLFDPILAQLEPDDRRSLLALHTACRAAYGTFTYLEVGSHLGGSLQALVRDAACTGIISIDPRPAWQPDERGLEFAFPDNSTRRMLALLRSLPGAAVDKIHTFESTTSELDPGAMPFRPRLCFIDGEHTDSSALRDAQFCRTAIDESGCIAFHDAAIVYRAIVEFLAQLHEDEVQYCAYFLPSTIMVVELGIAKLRGATQITSAILDNYRGYLFSLQLNDGYRQFYNRRVFRTARRLKAAIKPNNTWR